MDADDTVAAVDARQFQLFHAGGVKTDAAVVEREGVDLYALYCIVFRINGQSQVISAVVTRYRLAFFVDLMCADG